MFKRFAVAAVGLLIFSACSSAPPEPPPPPPFDPAGSYNVSIDAQGMTIGGILTLTGSPAEGYTGSIDTDMGGAAVTNIMVEDPKVTFSIPDAGASVELTFEGDGFTGSLSGAMGDASIRGTKRAGD